MTHLGTKEPPLHPEFVRELTLALETAKKTIVERDEEIAWLKKEKQELLNKGPVSTLRGAVDLLQELHKIYPTVDRLRHNITLNKQGILALTLMMKNPDGSDRWDSLLIRDNGLDRAIPVLVDELCYVLRKQRQSEAQEQKPPR